ncbi:MAG: glycosyltransferase [Bacteroidota bacterium]
MPTKRKSLSVIIPTYNRCQILAHSLKSLLNQSLEKSRFELIVVDDGSSDETFELVKSFEDRIDLKFIYQADEGFRPATARNLGIRAASGELIVFIDSGNVLAKDCLDQHLKFHQNQERDVAAIGNIFGYTYGDEWLKTFGIPKDSFDIDRTIKKLERENKFLDIREKIYRKYEDAIQDLHMPWTLFWGGNLSIKKSSLVDVGMFDEDFNGNWGCEDNDLGYRLHHAGILINLCRKAKVIHLPHVHDDEEKSKENDGYKNCEFFHRKFPLPETQLFLDYYFKEVFGQFSNHDVIDFHELITEKLKERIV